MRDRPARLRRWSLARRLFVLQVVVVAFVVLAGAGLAWYDASRRTHREATEEVTAVARTLASLPEVRRAVRGPDPSRALQPLAEEARAETGVAFITIMSPEGVRYTHPDPRRIGEHFVGHIPQGGGHLTETYTGTLGPSARAVVPVNDDEGRLHGFISAGIKLNVLSSELRAQLIALGAVAVGALAAGGALTALVSARLRRHTHGLTPEELARRAEFHEATLHAVREGMLLVSADGRILLCNDGAAELLSRPVERLGGARVPDLGLPGQLTETLTGGGQVRDEVHVTDDRVVVVNVSPVRSSGMQEGTVVTLRDHTELQALSGELDSVRGFAEALRAQAHESANRLHAVVSLIELGRTERAVEFATAELAAAQELTDRVVGAVTEPVLAALLLGKSADAADRGVELVLAEGIEVDDATIEHVRRGDLVTIVGNLIDNAVEAVQDRPDPQVTVDARSEPDGVWFEVADNGPGVDAESVRSVFQRGWSTRGGSGRGLGLALVGQAVRRHGGSVDVQHDEGAVFTAWLPAAERTGAERGSEGGQV
ncbi:sensor histidine kinase [Salinifilum ghardaiensis]